MTFFLPQSQDEYDHERADRDGELGSDYQEQLYDRVPPDFYDNDPEPDAAQLAEIDAAQARLEAEIAQADRRWNQWNQDALAQQESSVSAESSIAPVTPGPSDWLSVDPEASLELTDEAIEAHFARINNQPGLSPSSIMYVIEGETPEARRERLAEPRLPVRTAAHPDEQPTLSDPSLDFDAFGVIDEDFSSGDIPAFASQELVESQSQALDDWFPPLTPEQAAENAAQRAEEDRRRDVEETEHLMRVEEDLKQQAHYDPENDSWSDVVERAALAALPTSDDFTELDSDRTDIDVHDLSPAMPPASVEEINAELDRIEAALDALALEQEDLAPSAPTTPDLNL